MNYLPSNLVETNLVQRFKNRELNEKIEKMKEETKMEKWVKPEKPKEAKYNSIRVARTNFSMRKESLLTVEAMLTKMKDNK